jgi:hypothetical protein
VNLFDHDPRCTCGDAGTKTKSVLTALLRGEPADLCPVHDQAAIIERERNQLAADAEQRAQLLDDHKARLERDRQAAEAREQAEDRENRLRRLAEVDDPLLAALARATAAPLDNVVPLNAKPSEFPALAGMTDTDSEPPPAA